MTDVADRQRPDADAATERREEDKRLVIAFKQGDSAAYDHIYRRYVARVNGICRRMLIDPNDVQEASQEVFLRVYQALGRFNGRYEMGAWIARIATNVCLDHLRAKKRRPQDFAPLEVVDSVYEGTFNEETPELISMQRAEGRKVKRLLASMPPMHRAAIVLRDFEGFSYEEIGKTLGITDVQVKALLHRARQSFKRSWAATVASALIPTRLLQKLKLFTTSSIETAAAGVAPPTIAQSCSTVLQSCGTFVVEKFVPVATALAVGAAGGAVAATQQRSESVPSETAKPAALSVREDTATKVKAHVQRKKEESAPVVAPEPVASATPTAEPSPAASPSEVDEAGGQAGGSQGREEQPPTTPTPAGPPPFSAALGFGATRSSTVYSQTAEVSCGDIEVEQLLSATMAHGDKTYGALVELDVDGDSVDFALNVYPEGDKYGPDVDYEADGVQTSITQTSERALLEYSGNYANTDYAAHRHGVPESGSFTLRIELDCATATVVNETLVLSA